MSKLDELQEQYRVEHAEWVRLVEVASELGRKHVDARCAVDASRGRLHQLRQLASQELARDLVDPLDAYR